MASCTFPNNHHATRVTVTADKDQRVRFSGKSAGAGIALSSSMGPAGIAIGVAIDEGIAKDIGHALTAKNFDIVTTVQNAFTATPSQLNLLHIHIVRYGFVTSPSNAHVADAVAPQLHLDLLADGQKLEVRVPEDIKSESLCPLSHHALITIRAEGRSAAQALQEAAQCAAKLVLE